MGGNGRREAEEVGLKQRDTKSSRRKSQILEHSGSRWSGESATLRTCC